MSEDRRRTVNRYKVDEIKFESKDIDVGRYGFAIKVQIIVY